MVLIISANLSVNYASEVSISSDAGNREIAPCSVYGIHRMCNTSNIVNVRYGSNLVLIAAGEYKCDCGDYFVCTGRPHLSNHPIGSYFNNGQLYNRQLYDGHVEWISTTGIASYTNSQILPGFRFYQ